MVKDQSFVVIQSWMVNDLHLRGAKLMVYAVIYGFSQDGESWYTGSASYLAEWCQATKRQVFNILNDLVDAGLIRKRDRTTNGVKLCDYAASFIGDEKSSSGVVKKVHRGDEKSSPHNIEDKIETKDSERGRSKRPPFHSPSLDECRAYASEIGLPSQEADAFYDHFTSNGWKVSGRAPMKDWHASMRNWKRNMPSFDRFKPADERSSTTHVPKQHNETDWIAVYESMVDGGES